jgi:hypothetical protein
MGFLQRIRRHNSARIYNDIRRFLGVGAVVCPALGVIGLLGFGSGATRISGRLVEGPAQLVVTFTCILVGVLLGVLRFTVFKERRSA